MPNLPIESTNLPEGLEARIVSRVVEANRRSLRDRLVGFTLGIAFSFAAIIPASLWLYRDAHSSGFTSFLSLALSDFDAVRASFGDFFLSLIESLPTLSLALLLALLALFFWSIISFFFVLHRQRGRKIHLAQ
jgi:hypothetical protein